MHVANPNLSNGTIVGVSCAILIVVYLVQPLGKSKIASTFAPSIIIWLTFNLAFEIYVSLFLYSLALYESSYCVR